MTSKTASDAVIAKGGASVAKTFFQERLVARTLRQSRSGDDGGVEAAPANRDGEHAHDADLEADAEAVLRKLSLARLMRCGCLYKQIALRRGLPFDLGPSANAETVAALEEAERGGGKAYRGSSREIIKAMLHDAE